MKFFLILFIVFFTPADTLLAQLEHAALKPGDRIQDMPLTLFKPEHQGMKFSDFKGKALILDVWSTTCTPCIAAMPKAHELQNKYNSDLKILLVNYLEPKEKVARFVLKRENIPTSKITLPLVLGDSLLISYLLKSPGYPLYFWINKEGILKYVTHVEDVTEKNVASFIKNDRLTLVLDQRLYNDSSSQNNTDVILWKTELGCGKVKGPTELNFKASGESGITCFNNSAIDLYRFAYGEFRTGPKRERSFVLRFPITRVLIESTKTYNPGRHLSNKKQSDSLFFYKMTAPNFSSWTAMSSVMINELNNCFGYTTAIEEITIKYLSLTIPDTSRFVNVSGPLATLVNDTQLSLNNITIREFLRNLHTFHEHQKNFLSVYPVVDESGYRGKIGNIVIDNIDTNDPVVLERELSKFGISLKLVERPVEMLVIRDKIKNQ